jgi:broad specificity phosphatase PhoE
VKRYGLRDVEFTRIFLVRHGQVASRWQDRIYGDMDVELSEYGRTQAQAAARRLHSVRFSAIISSDLSRAVYGAGAIATGRDLTPEVDPAFREMNRGQWGGLRFPELEQQSPGAWAQWFASPRDRRAPGGESLGELAARVLDALDRTAARHGPANVAVVSHAWPIRVCAAQALGLELEASIALELATGEIAVIDWPCAGRAGASGIRPRLAAFSMDTEPASSPWFQRPR